MNDMSSNYHVEFEIKLNTPSKGIQIDYKPPKTNQNSQQFHLDME